MIEKGAYHGDHILMCDTCREIKEFPNTDFMGIIEWIRDKANGWVNFKENGDFVQHHVTCLYSPNKSVTKTVVSAEISAPSIMPTEEESTNNSPVIQELAKWKSWAMKFSNAATDEAQRWEITQKLKGL